MELHEETINETSLSALDAYTASFSPSQVLQSSKWVRFRQSLGQRVRLFSWVDGNSSGCFLAVEAKLPTGIYYYIPRGPLGAESKLSELMQVLGALLKKDRAIFIRFEPEAVPKKHNFKKTIDIQPSTTLHTDISQSEEKMLVDMHQKTRYNIRLALKKKISFLASDKNVDDFCRLMKETAARDGFRSHSDAYYRHLVVDAGAQLATVRHNNTLVAAGIFFVFGDTMVYGHGASSSKYREVMAPYALHWCMMQYGHKEGLRWYDWHGIDEKKWPGFTRFKKGFGGVETNYPGTFDMPLAPLGYAGYTVFRYLRRLLP